MTEQELGKTLWNIAKTLRGTINPDDFRDYMLSFLFLRYLSDNYEAAAERELGRDYPEPGKDDHRTPLAVWYEKNEDDVVAFEAQMRRRTRYVIKPNHLWARIAAMARVGHRDLLGTLKAGFKFIENESFSSTFDGLFSEINLDSAMLGNGDTERNTKLCSIINELAKGLIGFSTDNDTLGDAYEYLIGEFAAVSGKKAGEFYTPQPASSILSEIVALDSQDPALGKRDHIDSVFDFACGSGSLLLNVRNQFGPRCIGKIYGQEHNITTYNLARMNMLLHGVKDTEFEIFCGDTLTNDWAWLSEVNPAKLPRFDAVVANPPFSYRWDPSETLGDDARFKNHGLAPKFAADFAFLLHGFHYLKDDGTMAIILPHGVLLRGGAEERIRTKLLKDSYIDAVIGLPANLFFSTGIPVCILVLKKCRKFDDVLFVNATGPGRSRKGKRQSHLAPEHIRAIVETYKFRKEEDRFSRRVEMDEIEDKDFNLDIARYVSIAEAEKQVDLAQVNLVLMGLEKKTSTAKKAHNGFLEELGLPRIP